jgi:hypothetical protein
MTTELLEAPALTQSKTENQDVVSVRTPDTPETTQIPSPHAPPSQEAPTNSPDTSPENDTDEHDDDDSSNTVTASLETDSLEFTKATISIHLQLLPHDDHTDGRPVIIGIRSHNLPPITTTMRAGLLLPLPQPIENLLEKWREQYPKALELRTTVRKQQQEKEKARKAKVEEDRKRRREEEKRKNHKPKHEKPRPQVSRHTKETTPATDTEPSKPTMSKEQPPPQSTLF